ncbi:MAG TPA: hypothetical protein K8W19_15395 [Victivallis vadensis]|nr:hypothetical protein [Victivallis vadensis]
MKIHRQFNDAARFGLSPDAAPGENVKALQAALDRTGTVRVTVPGIYDFNGTVLIGGNTALECGPGVFFRRTGSFSHLLLNKGAQSRTYDHSIRLAGLKLICDGNDVHYTAEIPGLYSHIALFYVKDLVIENFLCLDLETRGFCIQVCTFENILLENLHIEGGKDAVHLGRGCRFTIRHGVFRTYDDPIALNAYDYSASNPQFGWIEDGIIEDCHDLDQPNTTGFFCRMLSGAWGTWTPGMKVRNSDLAAYGGRLYAVEAEPDFREYTSITPPEHTEGIRIIDDIPWRFVQKDDIRDASVRNVCFRDIFLRKRREVAFCMLLEFNQFARSVYPGAAAPPVENISFENIFAGDEVECLLESNAPCDTVRLVNSRLPAVAVKLSVPKERQNSAWSTSLLLAGCRLPPRGGVLLACSQNRNAALRVCTSMPPEEYAEFGVSDHVKLKECDIPCKRLPAGLIERA